MNRIKNSLVASTLFLLMSLGASTAHGQRMEWENRGQPEFDGEAVDGGDLSSSRRAL